ncbi:phosphodiester glycosidase family protein [Streptomonospora wellingtoniae]|uniref:phosphodiester glycosidase family protein n=1 Tax=Streptomonospora wellingtoniae TaxID=3075544 RepID=UPI00288A2D2F|nr:phosphodiester glycosidase family protein [Streptomonospora sp. DSM 45055]
MRPLIRLEVSAVFHRAAAAALVLVSVLWPAAPAAAAADAAPREVPVAPGVVLAPAGADHAFGMLSVDLSGPAQVAYVGGGSVTESAPLAELAASPGTVAAVNGDFFDSGASNAPLGAAVRDGAVLKSPAAGHRHVAAIDAAGRGGIHRAEFSGTADLPGSDLDVDRLNSHEVPADGTGVFTGAWGAHPRSRAAGSGPVTELVVAGGEVRDVRRSAGEGAVEPGTRVLLGRGAAAERLAEVEPGARVGLDYTLRTAGSVPHTAVGGRNVLLRDGRVTAADDGARHPRTAIGFSRDGRRMFALVADGRVPETEGATLREAAERLRAAGAHEALELDGGGSATLLAREPGTREAVPHNRPGEALRAVSNGLAVRAPEGGGRARGVWVRPVLRARPEPGSALPVRPDPRRVFSGLSRALAARPYDSAYGPAPSAAPRWTSEGGGVAEGLFRAGEPGRARVAARIGGARGALGLRVLPGPDRLETDPGVLAFADASAPGRPLVVDGVAPDGTRAPVEPAEAEITVEPRRLAGVTRRDDGSVLVEPETGEGRGSVTIAAGGRSAEVPLVIGSRRVRLADFEDAGSWRAETYRAASAEVGPAVGREGRGLGLDYDFTGERRNRAAYAAAPAPLPAGGTAFGFRLRVRGDGNGALLALTVSDAEGGRRSVYGPRIDWKGWREAEFGVPEGTAHPVAVERVYLVETRSAEQYRGRVVFDDLRASVALDG